jgi:two-component system response regulator YesN
VHVKTDLVQAAFSHLLISGTLVHEASLLDIQQSFDIQVHPNVVMVLSIDRYPDLAMGRPFHWRREIGQSLVQSIHETVTVPFLWVWVSEGVLAILLELTLQNPVSEKVKEVTYRIAKEIQRAADRRSVSISIGIGSYCENPYFLHDSFEKAKESMIDRFFQGNQLIFHYEQNKQFRSQMQNPITEEEKMELLARVRIGDEKGTVVYLRMMLEKMAEIYQHNVNMFKSEAVDLMMMITRIVLQSAGNPATILTENAHFIQDLYNTIRYDKFVEKVCSYGRRLTEQVTHLHDEGVSSVIRQAILYMRENHQRKITLEEIAQNCCLSVYHFSHLFKKEVGISFLDYLNKIRIEKALYYLDTTDYTVKQIAVQVGFQDANYFSRMFKKSTGVSPSEYRTARLC